MNINNLNDDCLVEILGYLPLLDRLRSVLVCRKWAYHLMRRFEINDQLAREYIEAYTVLDKKPHRKDFTKFIAKHLKKGGRYIKILTLKGSLNDINVPQTVKAFAKYCKNITNLGLYGTDSGIWISKLNFLFKSNKNIRFVTLRNMFIVGDCFSKVQGHKIEEIEVQETGFDSGVFLTDFIDFISTLKNVKKLHVDAIDAIDVVRALNKSNCQDIYDFVLYDGSYKPPEYHGELLKLLLKQKDLRKAYLRDVQLDYDFLDKLTKFNLEFLELDFEKNWSYYSFLHFQNLRALNFHVGDFTDSVIKGVAECTGLKELEIDETNYLLSKIGEHNLSKLHYLESFKIRGRGYKNMDNLLSELSKCKILRIIHIKDKCKLTEVAINKLCLLPNLTDLGIAYSDATDDLLSILVKKSLKLKWLNIKGCINATNELVLVASEVKNTRKDKHYLTIIYKESDKAFRPKNSKINPQDLVNTSSLILLKSAPWVYD